MEPPTIMAPPEVGSKKAEQDKPWVECAVEECSNGECFRFESWVFRKENVVDYQSFLGVRNLEPGSELPGWSQPYSGSPSTTASVRCRERGVDVSLRCAQCIRLFRGGLYGGRGIAVGAHPHQAQVLACLSLSAPAEEAAESPETGTAFCNTVNARL